MIVTTGHVTAVVVQATAMEHFSLNPDRLCFPKSSSCSPLGSMLLDPCHEGEAAADSIVLNFGKYVDDCKADPRCTSGRSCGLRHRYRYRYRTKHMGNTEFLVKILVLVLFR